MAYTYKEEFIRFMVSNGVLRFGEFTLKSGRLAPYFINTGNYKTGKQLAKLGEYYATCIKENGLEADTLVGPAYKGIPLSVATAIASYTKYGTEFNYCFDRKEVKDHGEGGLFVGKQLEDNEKVIIIEDVMTSGKALKEILPKLGFDSITNYQFVHFCDMNRDYGDILEDVYREWARMDRDYAVPYYPHVSVGWDNNPRFRGFVPIVCKNNTPQMFESALRKAKEYVDGHDLPAPLITVNSWNEWTETSYLQPDTKYGYGYLDAIKRVFG